ncbi:MAG: hypothetical protein E7483_01340 [Ruminococcaceae bacterium]|nr:hypothetical protein [Oscillospiraceae bacterium]
MQTVYFALLCCWGDIVAIKSFTIRIDEDLLKKLHYVADFEGRSANMQIFVLIRNCVKEYETKHGEIKHLCF